MLSPDMLLQNRCYLQKHSNGEYQFFYIVNFIDENKSATIIFLGYNNDSLMHPSYDPHFSHEEFYPKRVYTELSHHDSIRAIFGAFWGLKKP